MRRREFLCGIAASALAAPAVAKTVHTFAAVNIGGPNLARITMTMEEYTPENIASALLGVTMVKQANGGWLIKGGERCNVGDSFTFDQVVITAQNHRTPDRPPWHVEKRHETI